MDFLQWLSSSGDMGYLVVLASTGIVISISAMINSTVRSIRLSEQRSELKQVLAEQGMSSDEIERILAM